MELERPQADDRETPGPKPVLEIRGLSKVYQWNGSSKLVLTGITFDAQRGELICLLGRSGCGKSTLLKILAGFTPPTSGAVLVDGEPITRPGPDRCVVFQEDALFSWLTVEENIALGLKGLGWDRRSFDREVEHYLSLVGLRDFRGYLPREISGGMKQRVALARVLILKPKVLLMDEPFSALDSQTREEMQALFLRLWKELAITVVFVTHDVSEALLLADRILVMQMNPGRIRSVLQVSLKRPRMIEEKELLGLSRELREALRH